MQTKSNLFRARLGLLAAATLAIAAHAQGSANKVDIQPQPLGQALNALALQTGARIIFSSELTAQKTAPAVSGTLTTQQALSQLLRGTDLVAETRGNEIVVRKAAPAAQPSDSGKSLDEVTVVDRVLADATSEGSDRYAAHAVTVGKTVQTLREVPQSVTVLTRQRLNDQGLSTVQDVMDQTPGIVVELGDNYEGTYYSRGFALSNIQIDGASFGSGGEYANNMFLYDRIEVLRGADGLFNGAGAPGGSIHLTRKRPTHEWQAEVNLTAGRWNNYRVDADIAGPLAFDGRLRGRLIASYEDREFFYDVADRKRSVVSGTLETDLPSTTIAVGGSYTHTNDTPWWFYSGLPRYSTGADLKLPRSTGLLADWSWWKANTKEVFARLDQQLGDRWKFSLNASHIDNKRESMYSSVSGPIDPVLLQGTFRSGRRDLSSNVKSIDMNLQGSFNALGREHKAVMGFDWKKTHGGEHTYRTVFPSGFVAAPVDIFNFDPGAYPEPQTGVMFRAWPSYGDTQKSFYGRVQFKLSDPLTLVAGARYASYDYESPYYTWDAAGNPSGYSLTGYKESGILTPYLGLVYDLSPEWTAYGSITEINISQGDKLSGPLPGSAIDPVEGRNYEMGIKGSLLNNKLNTSVAVFRIDQRNSAERDSSYEDQTDALGVSCCWITTGHLRSEGIEFEASGEVADGLQIFAGYTYNRNKNRLTNQQYSTFTPRHIFKLWSTYQLPNELNQWKVGAGVVAQSNSFKSGTARPADENGEPIPGAANIPFAYTQAGYAVWNARVDYKINQQWSAALQVNNLFDRTYYKTLGSSANYNWYGEPRNVMLTVRAKF